MFSENKTPNQEESNIQQEKPVKTQPSMEEQQESEEELTKQELEKIAGGFRRPGR